MVCFIFIVTLLIAVPMQAFSEPTQVESATNIVSDTVQEKEDLEAEAKTKNKPDPVAVAPPIGKFPATLVHLGETDVFSPYAFIVDKSTRTLSVWKYKDKKLSPVASYPSDMGRKLGDKKVLGDLKTPEGIYFFQTAYKGGQLDFNEYGSRAFAMDYPNFFDLLDQKTGSGIWLHAIPETKSLLRGSRGCVIVRDKVINKVHEFITLKKTPIVIQNQVQYINHEEHKSNMLTLTNWVHGWRKSWQSKDINSYISYYGEQFKALNMNRKQWRKYKENLNSQYTTISVEISEPMIMVHADEAVVKFLQAYQSNQKSDFGEKILYLKKDNTTQFRIIGEKWTAVPKKNITAGKFSDPNDSSL